MNQNIDEDGVRGLCAAIVLGAVEDWRKCYSQTEFYVPGQSYRDAFLVNQVELREFFRSWWFESLCEMIAMNPHRITRKLNATREMPYWREKRNARTRERRKQRRAQTAKVIARATGAMLQSEGDA